MFYKKTWSLNAENEFLEMKTLKKVLVILLALIIVVLIAGVVFLSYIKRSAIPDYNKNQVISGLNNDVEVLRDKYAIPHIYAENENDLYRATGYMMAEDRLWQMDLLRRVTQGRLSEVMGKRLVNTDLLMRSLRITEKSEKILKTSSPEIVAALNSFAEGVNAYIKEKPLPPEFRILGYKPEPWQPIHSINLIGYMAWDLSSGWSAEILVRKLQKEVSDSLLYDMIPHMKNQKTPVFPEFKSHVVEDENLLSAADQIAELGLEIFNGSNNWAVSGQKSKTGKPLLANDMHLGLMSPGIWYQIHQNVKGKLNVTGLAIPGQPFIIAGHNDSIAWGMTNVMVDDLDFYAEKLNEDSTKYMLDGEWKDLTIKNEVILTKEKETITIPLRFTHRGPIVNRFKKGMETPVSVKWLGNEMSNEIRSVYLLDRAANWSDFRKAASTFISVSQNVVYADTKGNIGLQTSAGIPLREGNGIDIYPGETSKYDWKGIVPFEELPFEFNPPRGYVSSANNKTVPDDYPYYISNWFATPSRINRIREMLDAKDKLGIEDFMQMQADVKSKTVEKYLPVINEALSTGKLTDFEKEKAALLEKWDGIMLRESVASTIFEEMYRRIMENLVVDELSPELYKSLKTEKVLIENLMINILETGNSGWIDDKRTPQKENLNDIICRSFSETISDLSKQHGNDLNNWQWGKLHTFTLTHPLGTVKMLDKVFGFNRGPYNMPGSFHTVCPYSYSYGNLYQVIHGASHRHIFDAGNWENSITVIPTGTSGIPASKHYLDQTALYINNQYHDDPFSFGEVEKSAVYRMKLKSAQ